MAVFREEFIHPSDKKALDALKAVPGFDLVMKKCMNIIGEKMFKIEATSSYLKLGPDQFPEIYEILVKVCRKLDIAIPDLYLSNDRSINAGTYGDTDVFIVLQSGLIETLNFEQIETIIAHECGHIVCHHCLYTTMGALLMSAAEYFANGFVSTAIVGALEAAFYYWQRCSEFSADRVSAFYHESAEPVVDVMMSLAGGYSNFSMKPNREAFFKQAQEYKVLIDNSAYNKALEILQFWKNDHPLLAYRAYEVDAFYRRYTAKYLGGSKTMGLLSEKSEIESPIKYILRVKYEYIRPKNLLKLGGVFDNEPLSFKIGTKKYAVNKNGSVDISLDAGSYEISFSNSHKRKKYTVDLNRDMILCVSYDAGAQKIEIKDEI